MKTELFAKKESNLPLLLSGLRLSLALLNPNAINIENFQPIPLTNPTRVEALVEDDKTIAARDDRQRECRILGICDA